MDKAITQFAFDFAAPVTDEKPLTETVVPQHAEMETPAIQEPLSEPEAAETIDQNIEEVIAETGTNNVAPPKTKTSNRGRRSLKEIDINADLIDIPPDEILFQKQYYAIGEVAKMFRVNQSLLRFWEAEFSILKPKKNGKGDRFFRAQDVKHLQLIYDLLRRRKFTIEGAKDYIKSNKTPQENFAMIQSLEKIKSFLLQLKASL